MKRKAKKICGIWHILIRCRLCGLDVWTQRGITKPAWYVCDTCGKAGPMNLNGELRKPEIDDEYFRESRSKG